jgi:hypothetical protein
MAASSNAITTVKIRKSESQSRYDLVLLQLVNAFISGSSAWLMTVHRNHTVTRHTECKPQTQHNCPFYNSELKHPVL